MVAAGIFPLGELLIACGLMLPRIQRPAAWLGICLHVVLILILGPIGLKHHLGVLIWNLFFIAQLAILFLASRGQQSLCEWSSFRQASLSDKLAVLCVLGLVVAPLAEPLGCIDHWPAWQLYAPRNSRVTMQIFASAVEKLPAELRQHVKPGDGGPLVRVDLDGWSLTSLSAPIYPQDRFQLGVAAAVARDYALGGAVVVTRQGVANRWTGRRNEVILRGSARILEEIDGFRLNAQPR